MNKTDAVMRLVLKERVRQEQLCLQGKFHWTCADSTVTDPPKYAVLGEEVGEVARHVAEAIIDPMRRDPAGLREELIQVAAVCVAWAESLTL